MDRRARRRRGGGNRARWHAVWSTLTPMMLAWLALWLAATAAAVLALIHVSIAWRSWAPITEVSHATLLSPHPGTRPHAQESL